MGSSRNAASLGCSVKIFPLFCELSELKRGGCDSLRASIITLHQIRGPFLIYTDKTMSPPKVSHLQKVPPLKKTFLESFLISFSHLRTRKFSTKRNASRFSRFIRK